MPADQSIDIRIRLRDIRRFIADSRQAEAAVKRIGVETHRTAQRSNAGFGSLAAGMNAWATIATRGAYAAGAGVSLIGFMGLKFQATMESNSIALKQFLGTEGAAREYLDKLFEIAKMTPFRFDHLTTASRKFMAFGFTAEETIKYLETIGDTVAGIGGGDDEIQRLVLALGQMQAKSRVMGQEMLQLNEIGIPAQRLLQEELGLTAKEVAYIGEQGIAASEGIPALIRGLDKLFGGQSARQAKSFSGQLSTLKDNLSQAAGMAATDGFGWLRDKVLPDLNSMLGRLAQAGKTGGLDGMAYELDQILGGGSAVRFFLEQMRGIVQNIKDSWPTIKFLLVGLGAAVLITATVINKAWMGVIDVIGWVKRAVRDVVNWFEGVPAGISAAAAGMWDGIAASFRQTLNWIISRWNGLEFRMPSIDLGPLGKVGGFIVGMPDIAMLADGGTVRRAGSAIVGERGPELLELPAGAKVTPLTNRAGAIAAAARGALGGASDLVVHTSIELDRRVIGEAVNRYTREQYARA
jgi:tape measure domain-containing protein